MDIASTSEIPASLIQFTFNTMQNITLSLNSNETSIGSSAGQHNIAVYFMIFIITLSGIVSNSITISVFVRMGSSDVMSKSFLTLAISDLFYTAISAMQGTSIICTTLEKKSQTLLFPLFDPVIAVIYLSNIGGGIITFSTLVTSYVAIVRCVCIAMPIKFKTIFTRGRSNISFVIFLICSLLLHAPNLATLRVRNVYQESINHTRLTIKFSTDREKIMDIVWLISFFGLYFISEIIVVVCLVIMTVELKKSTSFRRRQEMTPQNSDSTKAESKNDESKLTGNERSIVLQVVIISFIFIMCNLFRMTRAWLMILDPSYSNGGSRQQEYLTIGLVSFTMDCIKASVNFYVFSIFNKRFRNFLVNCRTK